MSEPAGAPGPGPASIYTAGQVAYQRTPTPGEGFTLSLDQARSALEKVNGFIDELTAMRDSARNLQRLTPPAQDVASVAYNKKLTGGVFASVIDLLGPSAAFDAGVRQIQDEIDYLTTLRAKLHKALGMTEDTEDENKKAVAQAGTDQGGLAGG